MASQICYGTTVMVGGCPLFSARVSESITESGASAAATNAGRANEVAEIVTESDCWAAVNQTAAAGTTYRCQAGAPRWIPLGPGGGTINIITA